jgi:hypothetical protein
MGYREDEESLEGGESWEGDESWPLPLDTGIIVVMDVPRGSRRPDFLQPVD